MVSSVIHPKSEECEVKHAQSTTRRRIKIFDTTLRDGEQSPGASMTVDEKIRVARQLDKLGVDVIEAGFPAASAGDFDAVYQIAASVSGPTVCALARCKPGDIEAAAQALQPAVKKRIHVFIATSEIHMAHKLKMNREAVIEAARQGVAYARQYTADIEFSAEDATRSDPDFLCEVFAAAVDAGATTINVPDTVGYTTPQEYADLIKTIRAHIGREDSVDISVHCHNDLGLATANSLAAVAAGASQVECTINGIGERSGNCAMEEVVMGLQTRQDCFAEYTGVVTREIVPASRLVSEITGIRVQPNKAIVGSNAFAHEAGIHQHGVIAHRETYEIMRAEDVGFEQNSLVIGKHSGRAAIRRWLENNQIVMDEDKIDDLTVRIKNLADVKKKIVDQDIFDCINLVKRGVESTVDSRKFMGGRAW